MGYKEKIIDMIEKINNLWILEQIYMFIQNITRGV